MNKNGVFLAVAIIAMLPPRNEKLQLLSVFLLLSITDEGERANKFGKLLPSFSQRRVLGLVKREGLRNFLPLFLKEKLWHLLSGGTL